MEIFGIVVWIVFFKKIYVNLYGVKMWNCYGLKIIKFWRYILMIWKIIKDVCGRIMVVLFFW